MCVKNVADWVMRHTRAISWIKTTDNRYFLEFAIKVVKETDGSQVTRVVYIYYKKEHLVSQLFDLLNYSFKQHSICYTISFEVLCIGLKIAPNKISFFRYSLEYGIQNDIISWNVRVYIFRAAATFFSNSNGEMMIHSIIYYFDMHYNRSIYIFIHKILSFSHCSWNTSLLSWPLKSGSMRKSIEKFSNSLKLGGFKNGNISYLCSLFN